MDNFLHSIQKDIFNVFIGMCIDIDVWVSVYAKFLSTWVFWTLVNSDGSSLFHVSTFVVLTSSCCHLFTRKWNYNSFSNSKGKPRSWFWILKHSFFNCVISFLFISFLKCNFFLIWKRFVIAFDTLDVIKSEAIE